MNAHQVWALAYVTVMGIRLHPKNDGDMTRTESIEDASRYARLAAHRAVLDHLKENQLWQSAQPQSGAPRSAQAPASSETSSPATANSKPTR